MCKCMRVSVSSLSPNDYVDQSSLWDLAKLRGMPMLRHLSESLRTFLTILRISYKKRRFGNCKSFSLNRQYSLINRTQLIIGKMQADKRDAFVI